MKLFEKIEKEDKTYYKLLSIPVVKIKKAEARRKVYFLGIQVLSSTPKSKLNILDINKNKNLCIYFDHSHGGGAEIYFYSKLKEKLQSHTVVRIQEVYSDFKFTMYSENGTFEIYYDWKTMLEIISDIEDAQIYINNLVGYKKKFELLKFLELIKNNGNKIIILGHDYLPICPSWNLINNQGEYCKIPDDKICESCAKNNKFVWKKYKNTIKNIRLWKKKWSFFLQNVIDELIVFSQSSKEIFVKAYPFLEAKIKIEAHKVKSFERPVYYEKRETDTINISVIGNICHIKGSEIVKEMGELLNQEQHRNIKITVIGKFEGNKNIKVTGEYEREDLPKLLAENKTDIVFIPSICPETFSYTTSEAMILGYPVACFDIGAPAERVAKYDKGLVIKEIKAKNALKEISNFINKGEKNGN